MTYNSEVIHEQGGSVLRIDSTGSISLQSGGTISGAGTIQSTGAVTLTGLLTATGGVTTASEVTATSITVLGNGVLMLGSNVRVMFAVSAAAPSGLPVSASPGAVFFRSDGANSAGYVNTSDGATGSVWTIFSEL